VQRIDHTVSSPLTNGFRSSTATAWRLEEDAPQVPTPTRTPDGDREPPKKPNSGTQSGGSGTGSNTGSGPGTSPTN